MADIAIQAALTGHLVFSTLHTNDAPGAITRLIDIGVKPFLVASAIQAIMAQRLVRVICKECRAVDENPETKLLGLLDMKAADLASHPIYHGVGCNHCHGTGYRGRLGVFEMMMMNNEIREMAFNKTPSNKIRQAALASGMRGLLEDGKQKIMEGITGLEDVVRIAQTD